MWKFLKYTFATFIGASLGILFVGFISAAIVAAVIASSVSGQETVDVEDNSLLLIEMNEPIVEREQFNPLKDLDFASMKSTHKLGLLPVLNAINDAKTDPKIRGILLQVRSTSEGLATIDEVRNALEDFKSSGKFIISYSDYQDQKAYYLSSVANRMYLHPEGLLEFKGMRAEMLFFTKTLEKLGIEPDIIRNGKYKSAIEPFTQTQMSPANREQMQVIVDNLWKHILNGVSAQRSIPVNVLDSLADNLSVSNVQEAVKARMIDETKYYDQVLEELKDSIGITADKTIPAISLADYCASRSAKSQVKSSKSGNKIAVVYAFGDIVPGEGDESNIGGDRIAREIRRARTDKDVKAVLLRINSGGGSALASDVIWREMDLTRQTKPTVVSMGDYAASGGYYIACPANAVVAGPATITGSIGVFGLMMTGKPLLNNIGITTDVVKSNEHADIGSFTRKMTDFEKAVAVKEIDKIYDTFISHVAQGRDTAKSYIDSIAQGRVWTGVDAQRLGLIDAQGGFLAALKITEDLAEISDYTILELPESNDAFSEIMKMFQTEAQSKFMKAALGDTYKYYEAMQSPLLFQGVQARMPYTLDIE